MIKRMIAVVKRDIKSSSRDALMLYILLSPIAIAFLLRIFIPSVDEASLLFGVLEEDLPLSRHLSQYGKVETFGDLKSLEERVDKRDDLVAVVDNKTQYAMILEGNEALGTQASTQAILMDYNGFSQLPLEVEVSDLGWKISSVASVGTVSLIMLATILGGMFSGLNIVEERQLKTIKAIQVSPIGTSEFLVAKCMMAIVIPLLQSIVMFFILGFTQIDFMKAIVICVFSSLIGMTVGMLLGVINDDPLTAAAGLKVLFLPMSATILGALLLPEKLMFLLYPIPYYWTYKGITEILYQNATWQNIIMYSLALCLLTGLLYIGIRPKIKRGLAS